MKKRYLLLGLILLILGTLTFGVPGLRNFVRMKELIAPASNLLENGANFPASDTTTIQSRVILSVDDAEEDPSGSISLSSSDLEMAEDGKDKQVIGILFRNIVIPQGVTILSAHMQFKVDDADTIQTSLVIQGEDADNPAGFNENSGNISNRPRTAAAVFWTPPAWASEGAAGPDQQTPDISTIIQEIVDRQGWTPGNSLGLIIRGTGTRTAESYDGDPSGAPLLNVKYAGNPVAIQTPGSSPTTLPPGPVLRIAVIGDFGDGSKEEARVAALVNSWSPDFVITIGDNNYPDGEATTIDTNIGQFYSQYIGNYQGSYGPGSDTNRFWPSLGNHDWQTILCSDRNCEGVHFDYFTLPGNERYYDVDYGLVHLFALDNYHNEPDGVEPDSTQAHWLQNALAASSSCFNLVYFHQPPYSSGHYGSFPYMRWPYQEWGADAVFSGHEHSYERLDAGGFPYFVNGSGGVSLRDFPNTGTLPPEVNSMMRYNEDHGAMLITAHTAGITYQFYNASYALVDELSIPKDCRSAAVSTDTLEP